MGAMQQNPTFLEPHFTVAELAARWGLSNDTVRRIFEDVDDVIEISRPRRRTRRYTTIRIPESVAARVYAQLTKRGRDGQR